MGVVFDLTKSRVLNAFPYLRSHSRKTTPLAETFKVLALYTTRTVMSLDRSKKLPEFKIPDEILKLNRAL